MKELTCIVCPRGCTLQIDDASDALTVTGHSCKRGEAFARAELTNPMRTICTTVKTVFPEVPVLPVRVSSDIPKARIFDVMKAVNAFTLDKRVARGETVLPDVCGLGVDVIATSGILTESGEKL